MSTGRSSRGSRRDHTLRARRPGARRLVAWLCALACSTTACGDSPEPSAAAAEPELTTLVDARPDGPSFPVRLLPGEAHTPLQVLLEDALDDLDAWWVLEGEQLVPAAGHPDVQAVPGGVRLARAGTTLVRLRDRPIHEGGTLTARLTTPGEVYPPGDTHDLGVHELRELLHDVPPTDPRMGRWLRQLLDDPGRPASGRWTTASDTEQRASAAALYAGVDADGRIALVFTAGVDDCLVDEARLTGRPQVQRRSKRLLDPGEQREPLTGPEREALRLGVEQRECLLLGPGHTHTLGAEVPPGARALELGVGPLPGTPVGLRSTWTVSGRLDDGPEQTLGSGEVLVESDVALMLSFADQLLAWPDAWTDGGHLQLRLAVSGDAELAFAQPLVRGAPRWRRPNVLLISIDTVRADHLGWHGYERPTTPRLDAFVSGGTAFLNASSAAPFTLPSHASLLTGLLPVRHGAVNGGTDALDATAVPYLPQLLADHGWHTVAFTGGGMMSSQYGFASGFDRFRAYDPINTQLSREPLLAPTPDYTPEQRLQIEALQIEALPHELERFGDEPWFAFVHTFAAHNYTTPESDLQAVVPGPPHRGWGRHFTEVHDYIRQWNELGLVPDRVARLQDLYDGALHHLDQRLGSFLATLRARGLLDDTLVVLFSDHGEEFAEHGGLLHGNTLYQEMLHVPLVILGAGLPVGRQVGESVTLTDVVPTLLELLGIPEPEAFDGRSLVPLLRRQRSSPEQPPRMVSHVASSRASGMSFRSGRFKLVRMRRLADDGRSHVQWSLFDLGRDPGETTDLADARPDVVSRLRESLEALERRLASQGVSGGQAEIDSALAEQLRALGYADFVPDEGR